MAPAVTCTFLELWREARREVALRKNVYKRWISEGRMNRIEAAEGITKMEAIAAHLEPQAKAELDVIAAERAASAPKLF